MFAQISDYFSRILRSSRGILKLSRDSFCDTLTTISITKSQTNKACHTRRYMLIVLCLSCFLSGGPRDGDSAWTLSENHWQDHENEEDFLCSASCEVAW
ncbi:hypothetical protein BV25DRAFT_468656 [Artomyces pyxidatus]|uniref:Uncharacterized protein n=1 Tax=Artomyces pyxidatus TaxID=48021 RepID=A0ACB8SFV7_9AGAM|nr:hypothetical protein BV25DRAFT_468656 [Artomyces pyxidatus]